MLMKMKCPVAQIPVKRLNKKHRFGIFCRNVFHRLGIQQPKSNKVQRVLRIVPQKLFNRPKLARLYKAADSVSFISNDNAVCTR